MLPSALKQKLAAKPAAAAAALKQMNKRKHDAAPAAAAAADAPLPKRKIRAKLAAAHRRPLTTDEINRLQESTSTLTNESLYALQIDEILRASQLPTKYERFVYNWLPAFNAFLRTLRSDDDSVASDRLPAVANLPWDAQDAGVTVPPFQYRFIAPRAPATPIGSYATGTLNGPAVRVDVAVEMPAQFFQKHDYLNLVYHRKRALYVHRLATELGRWSSGAGEVRFAFDGGDRLRPLVELLAPRAAGVRLLRIHVHVVAEPNAFKLSRFLPGTSNVRDSLFGAAAATAEDAPEPVPTPHYNAGVLRDLTLQLNEQFVQKMLQPDAQRPVREALRLCKLWLRARGLGDAPFGGAQLAAFAVLLVKQRKLHPTMSAYDVLRQLWLALATSRWHEAGQGGALAPQPAAELAVFHGHYEVVLVDVSGYLNLCATVPVDVYLRVREESQRALRFLTEEATLGTFRLLFASGGRPAWQQYDHVIK